MRVSYTAVFHRNEVALTLDAPWRAWAPVFGVVVTGWTVREAKAALEVCCSGLISAAQGDRHPLTLHTWPHEAILQGWLTLAEALVLEESEQKAEIAEATVA